MPRFDIDLKNGVVERGLPFRENMIYRLFERAKEGTPVTIGFLGGSITQGSAATDDASCYAYLVYQWFVKNFPDSKIKYVNAGIGATDSEYAAARVKEDLLSANPDFVLMEFAVNDGCNEHFKEAYEGTLRQILSSRDDIAVLLMANVFYDEGRNAERIHRSVARHYGIPMVSMRTTIYEAILGGKIPDNRLITPDDLHPNDAGHALVSNVICHFLESVLKDGCETSLRFAGQDDASAENRAGDENQAQPELIRPLTPNRYEHSIKYDMRNSAGVVKQIQGFTPDTTPRTAVKDCFRYGYSATEKGSFVEYEVEGSCIAVLYRRTVNKPAPVARVVIDGNNADGSSVILDANFEEDWGDKLELTDVYVSEEPAKHTVRIEITEAHAGDRGDFYLAGIIVSG